MTEARFKIVFDGELMPDVSPEQAQKNLAELFKSSADRVAALFSGATVVLKRDLNEAAARQYQQALHKAGANVRIEAQQPSPLSLTDIDEAPQSDAAAQCSMECPKCGHTQPQASECSECGVIIEKYLARQATLAAQPAASPYAPPRAQSPAEDDGYCDLPLWGVTGRLGRMRSIAWNFVVGLASIPLIAITVMLMPVSLWLGITLTAIVCIGLCVVVVQIFVKRLHDIGWSGWLALLLFVPVANIVISLISVFAPGTPDRNAYGAPPPPNSTAVVVLFWICVAFTALYIIGTIVAVSMIGMAGLAAAGLG